MKDRNVYSDSEIVSNINKLMSKIDMLKTERASVSKNINDLKKQVLYWEELDKSQIKINF